MRALGLILIVCGVLGGPLLTAWTMVAAHRSVQNGVGEAAIQSGIEGAMTASIFGLGVSLIGFALLATSWYRGRRTARAERSRS